MAPPDKEPLGGGPTPAYDAKGNLTNDGVVTMGYDSENRMTTAPGTANNHLFYDPLGRLWGAGNSSPAAYYESADGLNVAERNSSGTVTRRHGLGPWPAE